VTIDASIATTAIIKAKDVNGKVTLLCAVSFSVRFAVFCFVGVVVGKGVIGDGGNVWVGIWFCEVGVGVEFCGIVEMGIAKGVVMIWFCG